MSAALIDALGGFAGVTIRVRHELDPASMRLMDTLGASVVVDPDAPECVAFAGSYSEALRPGGCARCRVLGEAASGCSGEAAREAVSPNRRQLEEEAA